MTNYKVINTEKHPVKMWTKGVDVESAAQQQLKNIANLPFVHKWVAAMPDCHWGNGAAVGSVIATDKAIIPSAVGVDLGCVDQDTEFLTPSGWKKISDYQDGDQVMQYSPESKKGNFVSPINFIKKKSEGFYWLKTKYGINQMLSRDHKMLIFRFKGKDRHQEMETILAKDFVDEHKNKTQGLKAQFETAFEPDIKTKVDLTTNQLRIFIMTAADGCFSSNSLISKRVTLKLKKERKIQRARKLLQECDISFVEKEKDGIVSFYYDAPIRNKCLSYLWPANKNQLEIIFDEIFHWDGNSKDKCFYTRKKESADFVHYLFSAMGYRSSLREDVHKKDQKIDYRVFAIEGSRTGIFGHPRPEIEFGPSTDGYEYCFTLPSGFWVMRRGGCIAVTGNCGMMALKTSLKAEHLPDNLHGIRTAIEKAVPHGRTNNGRSGDRGAWGNPPKEVLDTWHDFLECDFASITEKHPKIAKSNNINHLGTLGTGNHFIELCLDESGCVWIMLHSGSRGVGGKIGQYFITKAKEEMAKYFIHLVDNNLAYLPEGTESFDDYVQAVHWAQTFASLNRQIMMHFVVKALRSQSNIDFNTFRSTAVNCHHNYVERENHYGKNVWVTRKGAVRARKNDLGIIPGSMGAKSFIVRGKQNNESFHSCSHGAGRKMSRTQAKKIFSLEDHKKATEGIECRKDADVIDETPGAYKDIDIVMEAQKDLVEIVHTLRQVVCVKG